MIRSSWMLGMVFLFACGVESAPVASQSGPSAGESVAASALSSPQIAGVCTPGETRWCCALSRGCACMGEQFCEDDGQWDECYGATPAPGPCQ